MSMGFAKKQPYFEKNGIKFMLMLVSEDEMDGMIRSPETGMPRLIEGYPAYYTKSGRLYPIPIEGIEIHERPI